MTLTPTDTFLTDTVTPDSRGRLTLSRWLKHPKYVVYTDGADIYLKGVGA